MGPGIHMYLQVLLVIHILLCYTKASASFSLLCKGHSASSIFEVLSSLSHRVWMMASFFQTRKIGWHNGIGFTDVQQTVGFSAQVCK